jgi:pimeloyl-ACP methyl ester carboxylesterase
VREHFRGDVRVAGRHGDHRHLGPVHRDDRALRGEAKRPGPTPKSPARIITEKVSRRGMPDDIPRTWILTTQDRALTPRMQRGYIEALGGVHTLVEMDTCHMPMVTQPERLAEILVERCLRYAYRR